MYENFSTQNDFFKENDDFFTNQEYKKEICLRKASEASIAHIISDRPTGVKLTSRKSRKSYIRKDLEVKI